jgi:uncharacterized protein (DUF488 family)
VPDLLTVGHGTLAADGFTHLLREAGVELVVDVRAHPGSRRHPHFTREAMAGWLSAGGVDYRWEGARLGGRRSARADSPNLALRNAAFRGFADHMATAAFAAGLADVLDWAAARPTAVMCAESLWWRCHRRLVADAAVLGGGACVRHLLHDGRLTDHVLTGGARRADADEPGPVVYDGGLSQPRLL